ncbi:MAG: ABC transporter ATP-binding protein [Propionibacteriaceae bacterium]|nr:ABC transporter ATP-binding protein [Propionibacteriaceae bacterium]
MPHAITASGLRKTYGDFVAVNGLDLQVNTGEVFAFLGPNGAGKTTTIDILTGAQRRTSGAVEVLGRDPQRDERGWRAQVGVVPQGTAVYPTLTVTEIIDHFAAFYPDPFPTGELVDLVGLGAKANVVAPKLSGGQRRRLDVAVGMVGRPKLLFLDEPTTGLDPEARREAWDLIRLLTGQGMTTVLTTHYLDEAQELAQRAGIIVRGRMLHVGTLGELAQMSGHTHRVSYALDPVADVPSSLAERLDSAPGTSLYATNEPSAVLRLLLAAADRCGVHELPGLQVVQPSLEQVYISMIESAKEEWA